MSDSISERVTCPGCSKGYRWQTQLVGRVVPCKACDTRFTVPDLPGRGITHEDFHETYELDLDRDEQPGGLAYQAVGGKCPNCNSPLKSDAVLCLNCGFNLREGKRMQTAVLEVQVFEPGFEEVSNNTGKAPGLRPDDPEILKQHYRAEFIYPLAYLVAAAIFLIVIAFFIAPHSPRFGAAATTLDIALATLAYTLASGVAIIFSLCFAILFLVNIYGSGFGDLRTALLKVPALAFAAATLMLCVVLLYENWMDSQGLYFSGRSHYRIKGLLMLAVAYLTCYPGMKLFFDADSSEANGASFATLVGGGIGALLGSVIVSAIF